MEQALGREPVLLSQNFQAYGRHKLLNTEEPRDLSTPLTVKK
jgi:hypothetical protein